MLLCCIEIRTRVLSRILERLNSIILQLAGRVENWQSHRKAGDHAPRSRRHPKWDSVKWDSAKWDSAKWDSAKWDSAKWDSAKWDSAKWDSAKWGFDEVGFGKVGFGEVGGHRLTSSENKCGQSC